MTPQYKFPATCRAGMEERGETVLPRSCPVHGLARCTPLREMAPKPGLGTGGQMEVAHRYGFAMGDYLCRCMGCERHFDGAKRSIRCFDCAMQTHAGNEAAEAERRTDLVNGLISHLEELIGQKRDQARQLDHDANKLGDQVTALRQTLKECET